MESYWVACQHCDYGVPYNIGGESVVTVGEFLEILKQKSTCKIISEVDQSLLRPVDVTMQIPDVSKFISKTNWRPKYSIEESVEYLLGHYRKKCE